MNWVEEARTTAAPSVVPMPSPAGSSAPLAADGPRVCFAQPTPVNTPVASYVELLPLCGRATRKQLGDGVTTEKDLVTCPDCQAKLQAREQTPSLPSRGASAPQGAAADSAAPPPLIPTALLDALDSAALIERIAELTGEIEALKVLLKAARAREKAREKARLEAREETPDDAGASAMTPDLRAG